MTQQCEKKKSESPYSQRKVAIFCSFLQSTVIATVSKPVSPTAFYIGFVYILYWVCLYWVCFNKEQGLAFSNLVSPKGCHSFPSHPLWLALHLSPIVWMKRAWGSQYVHTHKHTHTQFDGMSDQLKRKNGALHRYGENLFSGIFVCGTHDFSWDHTSTFTKAIVMLNLL